MLARVLSAAVNGIEAFPVEVEVNCGWGDTVIVTLSSYLPTILFTPLRCEQLARATNFWPVGKQGEILADCGCENRGLRCLKRR
jgi:hypothetical protein